MRILNILILPLLIHGPALCQDAVEVVVSQLYDQISQSVKTEVRASIFDGYVISNDNVSANFRSLVRDNFQTSENAVVVTQKAETGDIQIQLAPETAEKIAKTTAPYLILVASGRQFDESIAINQDITIKLVGDNDIALSIILTLNNDTVTFRNADAANFVRGFSNAAVDAKGWYIKEFLRLIMVSSMETNN